MGRSKADLPFGSESMLQRVVGRLSQAVNHIVVVAAADQVLPDFAFENIVCDVSVARDEMEFAGPLAGLHVGLKHLQSMPTLQSAFATSCDVPFLSPAFVLALLHRLTDHDIVVPFDESHFHPMSAVYRIRLAETIHDSLKSGERRPRQLFDQVRTLKLPTDSLADIDPGLMTLVNVNSPSDYRSALAKAELPVPPWAQG